MNASFSEKKCEPCEGKTAPMEKGAAVRSLQELPQWRLDETGKEISREFITKNFLAAVSFINKVAEVAESENHHPDIHLTGYRKLKICLSTHSIGGLSENDFIVAAKINELPVELKKG